MCNECTVYTRACRRGGVGGQSITLLQGSQASPARPSGKSIIK